MRKLMLLILLFGGFFSQAQIIEPIKWSFSSKQEGKEVDLVFTAHIDEGWHLYDTYLPEGGPIATAVVFEDTTFFDRVGELKKSPEPVELFDKTFQMNLRYFSHQAVLTQTIRLKTDEAVTIKGYVTFMGCNDETCLPPNEVEFSFLLKGAEGATVSAGVESSAPAAQGQAIGLFILISLLAGLAAVLTPCVFPMIPMPVSFFMRGSGNRRKAIAT
ncbi:MAG TPA: protein-disulfide reductase DsbD family protein, partial [Prolixibacteraceae bacterium]|nr:protein-disulfide reductase DsbD family protein [Prolixibacteraceae bacterium]